MNYMYNCMCDFDVAELIEYQKNLARGKKIVSKISSNKVIGVFYNDNTGYQINLSSRKIRMFYFENSRYVCDKRRLTRLQLFEAFRDISSEFNLVNTTTR